MKCARDNVLMYVRCVFIRVCVCVCVVSVCLHICVCGM